MIEDRFADSCPVCAAVGTLLSKTDLPIDVENAERSYEIACKYRCTSCESTLWTYSVRVRVAIVED